MIQKINNMTPSSVKFHHTVLVAGIAAIVADILPTPADALYFDIQRKLKKKQDAGEITAKQYWLREGLAYYTLNPLWWGIIMGITLGMKGDVKHKLMIGLGVLGIGAVVGTLAMNARKEKPVEPATT